MERNLKENGNISLANTFLTKGEKGATDNICLYKWLKDNKESTVTDLNDGNIDAEDKEFLEAAALFYNNNKEAYEK